MCQITLSTREKYIKPHNFLGLLDFTSSIQFLVQIVTLFALSDHSIILLHALSYAIMHCICLRADERENCHHNLEQQMRKSLSSDLKQRITAVISKKVTSISRYAITCNNQMYQYRLQLIQSYKKSKMSLGGERCVNRSVK